MEDEMFKVSELPKAENIKDEDIMMIVQDGINKKIEAKKIGSGGSSIVVEDTLESDSTTNALSAKQGEILNNKVDLLSGKFDNFTTYTTEEIPIGNWIDGKTLYRKTVNVPNVNSSGQIVASSVSIADTNYETITSLKGIAQIVDDFIALPYTYDSNFVTLAVTASKNIRIYSKGYSTNQIFVTIEYTKTTD